MNDPKTKLDTCYRLFTVNEGLLSQPKYSWGDVIYKDSETEQELHDQVNKEDDYFEYTILPIYRRNFVFE